MINDVLGPRRCRRSELKSLRTESRRWKPSCAVWPKRIINNVAGESFGSILGADDGKWPEDAVFTLADKAWRRYPITAWRCRRPMPAATACRQRGGSAAKAPTLTTRPGAGLVRRSNGTLSQGCWSCFSRNWSRTCRPEKYGQVAQLAEHQIEKPRVGG